MQGLPSAASAAPAPGAAYPESSNALLLYGSSACWLNAGSSYDVAQQGARCCCCWCCASFIDCRLSLLPLMVSSCMLLEGAPLFACRSK